ncbi:MAG: carboxypeptidase regulatory-like domain-containing protein [Planctomycetes bacterium]|nr:carboxypeptidase regulatory-like domain-containing protein [Planctomycetota bacterium]
MSRFVPVLLVVVGLVAAWLFVRGDEGAPDVVQPTTTTSDRGEASPREVAPADAGAVTPSTPGSGDRSPLPVASIASWIVRGRVLRAPGTPHAGARIEAELFAGTTATGEPLRSDRLECGDEGRFAWPMPAPDHGVTLRFQGAMEGHGGWPETVRVPKGEAAPQDVELYVYPLDHVILGKVTDGEGKPIAGAWLRYSRERRGCEADGSYRIAVGSAFGEARLSAGAPGFAAETRTVAAGGEPEHREDFALRPAYRITGRVVDEAERPIAGAEVATFYTLYDPEHSDADGRFVVSANPDRERDSLFARAPGYVLAQTTVSTKEAPKDHVLVLRRGTRVQGRVTGPDGRPIAGAELYIGFSPSAFDRLDAISGDDGRFQFPAVGSGDQTLVTQRRGLSPDHRVLKIAAGTLLVEVDVQLAPAHFVAGIVVDESGAAMRDVRVSILVRDPGEMRGRGEYIDANGNTAADGSFRVEGLPAGKVTIELYASAIVRKEEEVDVDRDDLRLVVQRAASLAGRVIDDATGEAVTAFVVRLVRYSGGISATWVREGKRFHDAQGRWDTAGEEMPPGSTWGVEITAPGYAPSRDLAVVAALEAKHEDCVIRMQRGGVVAGRVLDPSGAALADAVVTWVDPDESVQRDPSEPHGWLRTRTDARGSFELRDVPAGETRLAIESLVGPRQVDGPFSLLRGERVDRVIRVGTGARLYGVVVDATGIPGESGKLELVARDRSGSHSRELELGADGRFEFTKLPAAEFEVYGWLRRGAVTMPVSQVVKLGSDETRELRLAPGGSGIVRATLAGDARVDDGTLLLLMPTPPRPGLLGCRGVFVANIAELHGVPAGAYQVLVFAPGAMGRGDVQVTDGARTDVAISLRGR